MTKQNKIDNMTNTLLSIYDYLKLEDLNGDMTKLNNETFTQMMFRKMKSYNIDLNKELGFTHLKPVKNK